MADIDADANAMRDVIAYIDTYWPADIVQRCDDDLLKWIPTYLEYWNSFFPPSKLQYVDLVLVCSES
jgi:hypothetical protein